MRFRRVAKEHGAPMLPHSFLFDHLLQTAQIVIKNKLPPDFHGHWMFHIIQQQYPEMASEGILYLDIWPINWPIVAVHHPGMITQFTQEHSLPKWWAQGRRAFKEFSGGKDLLHLEGQRWKTIRAIFNPGFSARNLLSLEKLRVAAKIVARAVLGTRLHHQTKHTSLMNTMAKRLSLVMLNLDIPKELSPMQPVKHIIYNKQISNKLMSHIKRTVGHLDDDGPKTVLALALKSYLKDHPNETTIPEEFLKKVIAHIKVFMFAGHDTTASTLAYILYCLSKNPEMMAKAPGARISEDPTVLNRMAFIIACMKESLRLFPPVGGTARQSPEGHMLVHPETGKRYPTYGFVLHSSVTTFLPERWLTRDESNPLYVGKNMWRPFELGQRTCIGHLRLMVTLTIRDFDFIEQYADDAPTFFGDKAYQSWDNELTATAHCKD
ncbi:cytochrome P450 [Xylariaceae sp. FL0255]|nr:cytochrome P450 [Xylariaceae sp. FL0255]